MMELKISIYKLYLYFVIISFLLPRGLGEIYSSYHSLSKLLVWLSVLFILIGERNILTKYSKIKINKNSYLLYFSCAIFLTFINRGVFTSGLQQLIAFPVLCLFLFENLNKDYKLLLEIIINVFIINYLLNFLMIVFRVDLGFHLTFLGHVQMIGQYSIVSILVSVIYLEIINHNKKKAYCLIFMTMMTLFITDASSAIICGLIYCLSYILYKFKFHRIICFKIEYYFIFMIIFSLLIIYMTSINRNIIPNLDFSGRRFVWEEALSTITQKPILGYGVDGVLLYPFWTEYTGSGFNYAHNQILQNMLDGGVILTSIFWYMFYSLIKYTNRLKKKSIIALFNVSIIIMMFIMIFDSTSLYCYMYFALIIIYYVSKNIEI